MWYTGRVAEEYRRNPNIRCIVCGNLIYRRPIEIRENNGRVFCGSACYGIHCRKEKPCLVCGQLILAGANKKTCSRACANKHRAGVKYKINRPRDKVKTYRALKSRLSQARGRTCEKCGHDRYEILEVHHKDRNRENNNLDNLELICPNCHAEEHYLGNSWFKNNK